MLIKKTLQFAYNYNFPTLTENRNIKIRSSEFSYLNLEESITSLNATAMEWKEQPNFEYSLIIRWFVCSPILLETVYSIPLQVRKKYTTSRPKIEKCIVHFSQNLHNRNLARGGGGDSAYERGEDARRPA